MVMQFGQFVDHDVALSPFNEEMDCCSDAAWDSKEAEDCFTIHIPRNDPFTAGLGRSSVVLVEDLDHSSPRPTKICIAVMHSKAECWSLVHPMPCQPHDIGSRRQRVILDYGEFAVQHDNDNWSLVMTDQDLLNTSGRKPCQNLVRSDPAPKMPDCSPGPRQQMNQITSWLDSSNVYGSDDITANLLR